MSGPSITTEPAAHAFAISLAELYILAATAVLLVVFFAIVMHNDPSLRAARAARREV